MPAQTTTGNLFAASRRNRGSLDVTDYPALLPMDEGTSPVRIEIHDWRLDDNTRVILTVEKFTRRRCELASTTRYTLRVGGEDLDIESVEKYYADANEVEPEYVLYRTETGTLVTRHSRISGTDKFNNSAAWCNRPLTPCSGSDY